MKYENLNPNKKRKGIILLNRWSVLIKGVAKLEVKTKKKKLRINLAWRRFSNNLLQINAEGPQEVKSQLKKRVQVNVSPKDTLVKSLDSSPRKNAKPKSKINIGLPPSGNVRKTEESSEPSRKVKVLKVKNKEIAQNNMREGK